MIEEAADFRTVSVEMLTTNLQLVKALLQNFVCL